MTTPRAADRTNNFDLLRLAAALQVVHAHAIEHLHIVYGPAGQWVGMFLALFPGVPIFFVISGFLISRAFERASSPASYVRNRVLRIYPALWVSFGLSLILLVAFGALTTAFVTTGTFWAWTAGQLTIVQFFNPDSLRTFGVGVVNGSLWTIPVELQFYAALPLLYGLCIRNRKHEAANALLAVTATLSYVLSFSQQHQLGMTAMQARLVQITLAPHLFMFLIGVLIQRNWERCTALLEGQGLIWIGLYLVARIAQGTWLPAGVSFASPAVLGLAGIVSGAVALLLGMAVLSSAFTARTASRRLLAGHDISYGVYLYHMLVVNVFVELGFVRSGVSLAAVFGVTILAAAASWLFIERPALQTKDAARGTSRYPIHLPALT